MFSFNLLLHMKLPRSNSQGGSMDRCHVFKHPLPYRTFPLASADPAYRQGRLLPRVPLYSGLLFEIIKYYIYL